MAVLANKPVLVLNKSWVPINISNLEDALIKLIPEDEEGEPKAYIIDTADYQVYSWADWSELIPSDGEEVIRGVGRNYRRPEVILVTHYDKFPQNKTKFSRRMIYKRDQMTCQYCGCQPGTEELNVDHIIPRSQGGRTTWENVVLSCIKCNSKKADRTPAEASMKLLRKPMKPKFALFKTEHRCYPKSFEKFISEVYWTVPLEKD